MTDEYQMKQFMENKEENLEVKLRDRLADAGYYLRVNNESLEFVVLLSYKYKEELSKHKSSGHHFTKYDDHMETYIGLNGDISHLIFLPIDNTDITIFNKYEQKL